MDKIPAVAGGSTWIRDLFERIRAVGWALRASLLRPPRRLANAPHSTPGPRRLVGLGIALQILSGAIDSYPVPELEVDPRVIIPLGPNSDPEIGSTLAPGLDQPLSSCSETLTKDSEGFPEPEANPILMHPLPVCASALTIPPDLEKTWSARTQHAYSDFVSQPDSNLRMPPKQMRWTGCNPSLMHPLPVSASAVAIPPGSPTGQCLEEQVLSSGSETTDSEPEIIGDVIRLVRTAALVSGADVERGLQRIISDFDVLPESEGTYDFIRRPRKAVNVFGTETAPKLERMEFQVSSDNSDFDVLSGSEESATYNATRSTAGLPSAGVEAVSDLEQTESSLSSSDAADSDDLSKCDRKDPSAAEAASDPEPTESSRSSSEATDSDDPFKRDRKDLSATVAANSSAGVLVEAEAFKYEGKGGKDSQGVKSTFGKLNPNAKEFIPRTAVNSGVFSLHSRQNLPDFREGLKLTGEEFQRPPWIEGNAFSLFSSPSDSKLDLGTALRMNFQGANKWTKWAPRSDFSPRSRSEVVWGSAGRKTPSSSKPGTAVQDHVKVPTGNKSATPPWGGTDRPQGHRPHHHPISPVHTVKASPNKAPVARERSHHVWSPQDVRLQSRPEGFIVRRNKQPAQNCALGVD